MIGDIVSGRLEQGAWLPREVDFAERFEISRGVVRETVQALKERGLIDVRHGRGAWVLPEDRWNVLDEDVLVSLVVRADRAALLDEVLECRLVLEPDAAALAAGRATEADVEALERALAAADVARDDDADDPAGFGFPSEHPAVRAEAAFHDRLVAAAGNRPLRAMLAPVHVAVAAATHVRAPGNRGEGLRTVLAAIQARDPGAAAEAVRADVGATRTRLGLS
ncbi:MAG TPA: FCD domain-containing protein [Solirubrobacteraceae bacterium]